MVGGIFGLMIPALAVLGVSGIVLAAFPAFWPVMVANTLIAMVSDVFGPAVAALTLGLYAHRALARRMGRNAAFDHAGNVAIAVVAGAVGWAFSQRAVLLPVPLSAVLAAIANLFIPAQAIDYESARGATEEASREGHGGLKRLKVLVSCRPLLVFALCVLLCHVANAPLLPLVGPKLAQANREWAATLMWPASWRLNWSCCRSRC
ncbi:hypothetical protein BB934_01960 [Microvirga ossetica]|uniref:Uncharacterized protein n=1 Tax=Microvirga ossetica TaxID=1882682 RepID=A0A1B2EAY2_9HYPH|nr:hypothetical protein [Microvirga ossetica]ANY77135.1 hypothetical protein BB934_01960 [Microvirga ossetica]